MQPPIRPKARLACALIFGILGTTGCLDIQEAFLSGITDGLPTPATPTDTPPGSDPDADSNASPPTVQLVVSNPSPQLNEEVLLTCRVLVGSSEGVTFDFQPSTGRLFVDRVRGTAALLIEESDIGVAQSFTCTGTSAGGTGRPSNTQVIIATE